MATQSVAQVPEHFQRRRTTHPVTSALPFACVGLARVGAITTIDFFATILDAGYDFFAKHALAGKTTEAIASPRARSRWTIFQQLLDPTVETSKLSFVELKALLADYHGPPPFDVDADLKRYKQLNKEYAVDAGDSSCDEEEDESVESSPDEEESDDECSDEGDIDDKSGDDHSEDGARYDVKNHDEAEQSDQSIVSSAVRTVCTCALPPPWLWSTTHSRPPTTATLSQLSLGPATPASASISTPSHSRGIAGAASCWGSHSATAPERCGYERRRALKAAQLQVDKMDDAAVSRIAQQFRRIADLITAEYGTTFESNPDDGMPAIRWPPSTPAKKALNLIVVKWTRAMDICDEDQLEEAGYVWTSDGWWRAPVAWMMERVQLEQRLPSGVDAGSGERDYVTLLRGDESGRKHHALNMSEIAHLDHSQMLYNGTQDLELATLGLAGYQLVGDRDWSSNLFVRRCSLKTSGHRAREASRAFSSKYPTFQTLNRARRCVARPSSRQPTRRGRLPRPGSHKFAARFCSLCAGNVCIGRHGRPHAERG